ncbi:MAG: tryptophan synthase subunit alpha [Candidatus Lokiarchaeota archaeon]|nr:tryptophan synthase subunit alpha [Candidatus Lokiarchaeota archaeon]
MKYNRIIQLFETSNRTKAKKFMPFLVAGDPNIEQFKKLCLAIEPYADILEIGIPFSDPIADGPTIQAANTRAFKTGINTAVALNAIKKIREKTEKPIVVLTYYNIIIQGEDTIEESLDKTIKKLKESGVDGIVIGDLPIEEAGPTLKACEKHDLCLIFLIAPSTTEERLQKILKVARGFIYLISVMGVTGARTSTSQITIDTMHRISKLTNNVIPILVGFGISKPDHVIEITQAGANGVIIGSAIVNIVERNLHDFEKMEQDMVSFVSGIKDALQ